MDSLKNISNNIRKNTLDALFGAQSGHPGASLSIAEILAVLFFSKMQLNGEARDRFILSKGHAAPALYGALAEMGACSKDMLPTLRKFESPLQGHPVRGTLPYIDASTGSLGQGLSMGIGYALGIKLKKNRHRVYVLMGDGETQEGQVWEAAMSAPKLGLDNLVAILDLNGFQNDGAVADTMPVEPVADKWRAFNWHVVTVDGHDVEALSNAFEDCRKALKPSLIIAKTVKGKGISFMEGKVSWHCQAINKLDYEKAIMELSK
ncbi:transketolase [uncultured Desulfobacter sp.]|uniref:transketolase n=1 Tax=uncultured Desulfobacter sp. TaxID=240139 RepID=UPI002AAA6BC6|nr:transketolase [uncultured Desulfobacter sp.]